MSLSCEILFCFISSAIFLLNNNQCYNICLCRVNFYNLYDHLNYIYHHNHHHHHLVPQHGYPWPSLATSPYRSPPGVGLQGLIPYPHIAAYIYFVFCLYNKFFVRELWILILISSLFPQLPIFFVYAYGIRFFFSYIYIYIYIYIMNFNAVFYCTYAKCPIIYFTCPRLV